MNRQMLGVVTSMLILGFIVAGCGGSDDAKPAASSGVPFDRAFIDFMVPHHRSAIEMAREAKRAGLAQPELVKVANDILASQQREIDQMLEWRKDWYGSAELVPEGGAGLGLPEAAMGMEHGTEEIRSAADVDQAFAEAMIPHHSGAIDAARLADDRAEHDELKDLAGDIADAQEREIEIMRPHAEVEAGGEHGAGHGG